VTLKMTDGILEEVNGMPLLFNQEEMWKFLGSVFMSRTLQVKEISNMDISIFYKRLVLKLKYLLVQFMRKILFVLPLKKFLIMLLNGNSLKYKVEYWSAQGNALSTHPGFLTMMDTIDVFIQRQETDW